MKTAASHLFTGVGVLGDIFRLFFHEGMSSEDATGGQVDLQHRSDANRRELRSLKC